MAGDGEDRDVCAVPLVTSSTLLVTLRNSSSLTGRGVYSAADVAGFCLTGFLRRPT